MSGISSSAPGSASLVHSFKYARATAVSALKILTGIARADVGAPSGFFEMMYLHTRPLSLIKSAPRNWDRRCAVVTDVDLRSP